MFIWAAIDVDDQLRQQKDLVKAIEKEIGFTQSNASLLPMHISLKISSQVSDENENELRNDIKQLFESTNAFYIETDNVELNDSIV